MSDIEDAAEAVVRQWRQSRGMGFSRLRDRKAEQFYEAMVRPLQQLERAVDESKRRRT